MDNNIDAVEYHYNREAEKLIKFLKSEDVDYTGIKQKVQKVFGLFYEYFGLSDDYPKDMAESITKDLFAVLWTAKLARYRVSEGIADLVLDVCLPKVQGGIA